VVDNLGLTGFFLDAIRIYVGVLAATILFIATNAGVIGASRITYAMASYRQLPEIFRRIHPRFKTPWVALVFFAGFVSILTLLPGRVDFLGTMYSFGAMLSFTIAHVSLVVLRTRGEEEDMLFRGRPNLRIGRVQWPVFAIVGGVATGLAWLVVVIQTPDTRIAGLAWLAIGFVTYYLYRRYAVRRPMSVTVKAPIAYGPALALEYRRLLVPVLPGRASEEALDVAAGLAAERGSRIAAVTVLEVPLDLPLSAELPEEEEVANRELDEARAIGDSYGVDVVTRLIRGRNAGAALVEEAERRGTEIIVIGAPRKHLTRGKRAVFGRTVDYVLKHAPCRVLVTATHTSEAA
jgi:APA family basic amino acid/polyamine antiporter